MVLGKSTIGRVIKESSKYENCKVVWENNNPLEVLVYNTAFVDEYFRETDILKGIFTLGKENVSLSTQINETKSSLNNINADLIQLKNTLNNKKEELNDLEKSYLDKFWKKMEPYKNDFIKCSGGCFGDKKKFKQKLIDKQTTLSNIQLKVIEELKCKYATIFADQPAKINTIPLIDILCILNYETNQILQKKIVGKDDINISGLIKKLDNSFWVKQGIQFYEKSGDICPFCQQKINNNLKEELENYFDENFTKDVAEIKQLYMDYKSEAERIEQSLKNIIIPSDFLNKKQTIYTLN